MEPLHFHYPAVFTAAIVSFAIGGLWYSPILFSQAWMKACGISEEQARAAMSRLTARFATDVAPEPEVSQVAYLRAALALGR